MLDRLKLNYRKQIMVIFAIVYKLLLIGLLESFKNIIKMIIFFDFSQATIDDVLCGTTVRAVVTRDFVTVQQEHTEYVKVYLLKKP
jgi:hypothetical protein